jgi:hypothetical protein
LFLLRESAPAIRLGFVTFPRLIPCRPARFQKIFARQPFKFSALETETVKSCGFSPPEGWGAGRENFQNQKGRHPG